MLFHCSVLLSRLKVKRIINNIVSNAEPNLPPSWKQAGLPQFSKRVLRTGNEKRSAQDWRDVVVMNKEVVTVRFPRQYFNRLSISFSSVSKFSLLCQCWVCFTKIKYIRSGLGFYRLCQQNQQIMIVALLFFWRNYARFSILCHFFF